MTLKVLKSKANTEAYATKRLERKQIMVKTVKRNIKEFLGMIKDGDVTLQPVYQRNECWKDDKKVKFIYSILSGYAELIPPFYYAINVDPETCVDKYKCIDSQQRTRTIIDFVNKS